MEDGNSKEFGDSIGNVKEFVGDSFVFPDVGQRISENIYQISLFSSHLLVVLTDHQAAFF